MSGSVHSIAHSTFFGISANLLFLFLHLFGLTCFLYIVVRRVVPLLGGASDPRWDRPLARLRLVLQFWLGQWKHPRYRGAGILHLLIFAGFLILITRASALLALGISEGFTLPEFYSLISAYAATVVFAAVLTAAIRRGIFKPPRYDVPERHGKDHSGDAIFLLGLIALIFAIINMTGLASGESAAFGLILTIVVALIVIGLGIYNAIDAQRKGAKY